MAVNNYDPSTALSAYYPTRDERRPARLWAREKFLHDMSDAGMIEFFEGPGTNPTALSGYSLTKLWLRVSSGVTSSPGEIRAYDGAGDASDIANWPILTRGAFLDFLGVRPDLGRFETRTDVMAAIIAPSVNGVTTLGYATVGDGGGGAYMRADGEPSHAGKFQSADGSWWELHREQRIYAEMFGAVADYDQTDGTGTDNDEAINDALTFSGGAVYLRGGFYRTADTVDLGVYRRLVCEGIGYFNLTGDEVNFFSRGRAAVLVPRGLPRRHVIDAMITQCELSGGVVDNPSSGESYATSSAGRLATYRIMDFTNQDASGATPATQRALSVAVKMGRGSEMVGVHVRTTRANGNFVSDDDDTDFGEQCDVGVLAENAFFSSLRRSSLTWAFRDAALLVVPTEVVGDDPDYYPQSDRFSVDECFLEGHCSFAVRGADQVRVSAVSTTELRVKWFKSHRFAATGSVQVNDVDYEYGSLTHDEGTAELVFGSLSADPDADGVAAGDALVRTQDARTFGTGGVQVSRSFVRSISHPSLKPSTDGAFTDYYPTSGRLIELSGLGVRGIQFDDTYFHGREDVSFFANVAADVYFVNCYHEAKFLNAGSGSSVSRWIGLSFDAKVARSIPQPIGNFGDVHLIGWSQTESASDFRPTWRTATSYGRFGSGSAIGDGLFEPSRCSNPTGFSYGSANFGPALVDRLPFLRGDLHRKVLMNAAGTAIHSVDADNRQAWGTGQWGTDADLTYAFNFYFGQSSVMNLANTSGTNLAAYRAENTAGNAWFGVDTDGLGLLRSGNISRVKFGPNILRGNTTNNIDLGSATFEFRDAFLVNSPTVSSDERLKQDTGDIPDAWLDAWGDVQWQRYRLKTSVEERGATAKWHVGLIAQRILAAFAARGIDALGLGLLRHHAWPDQFDDVFGADGEPTGERVLVRAAGEQYSVRYEQALVLEAAWTRREINRLRRA